MTPPENVLTARFRPSPWRTVERIRRTLGWSRAQLIDRLGITEREFTRLRASGEPLPAPSAVLLADQLGIRAEALFTGQVDFVTLERAFRGAQCVLPDRYVTGAFSRKRTSLHLIDFCERSFGFEFTDDLFRTIQVPRAAYSNPEEFVSIRSLTEISDFVANATGSRRVLYHAGANSLHVNRDTEMGRSLAACRSVRDAYELQLVQNVAFFDRNCDYRVTQLTSTHCVLESRDRSEVLDALELRKLGNPNTCMTRAGVAAAIAGFLEVPIAHVVETRCIHRGDSHCSFHIDFEFSEHVLRKSRRGCPDPTRLQAADSAQSFPEMRERSDSPTTKGIALFA